MNVILLSGGSGKRLWPLSNDIRSKQFIKIFEREDGEYESMIQRVYRQLKSVDPKAHVTIATARTQVSAIHNQLGDNVSISIEPERRDTFPAIALATAYLHDIDEVDENDTVVVCPVDPYVNEDYFQALHDLDELAKQGDTNLTLMGIEPTYPSEKYGYIMPTSKDEVSLVSAFKEKPDEETAKGYIEKGALWNGGVFAYRIGYLLDKSKELLGTSNYSKLYENYANLEKISFDYAVVEKEPAIRVKRFGGEWLDLGTWNMFTTVMHTQTLGNVTMDETCEDTNVINELDIPIVVMGTTNMVISAAPDGILVADRDRSPQVKPYVDGFGGPVMYSEKSWGEYQVIDVTDESMTIKVKLKAGHRMSYHIHRNHKEVWTILSGKGRVIIDDASRRVGAGDVVCIEAGVKHTIIADTDMALIEVQSGEELSTYDKEKFEME